MKLQSLKLLAIIVMVFWSGTALSEIEHPGELIPALDGEVYPVIAEVSGQEGVVAFQFVRQGEDFENWTRAVTYSNYQIDDIGDDPKMLASSLIKSLHSRSPGAKYKLMSDTSGRVLLLDYLSWPKGNRFMQLNVHRIQNNLDGEGVFLLAYAVRLKYIDSADEKTAQQIQLLRANLLKQIGDFNFDDMVELMKSKRLAE